MISRQVQFEYQNCQIQSNIAMEFDFPYVERMPKDNPFQGPFIWAHYTFIRNFYLVPLLPELSDWVWNLILTQFSGKRLENIQGKDKLKKSELI
jgi:hypothetical protein